jgi:hypothetical protein
MLSCGLGTTRGDLVEGIDIDQSAFPGVPGEASAPGRIVGSRLAAKWAGVAALEQSAGVVDHCFSVDVIKLCLGRRPLV